MIPLESGKLLELAKPLIPWDELPCIGYKVKDSAINKLCSDMKLWRKRFNRERKLSESIPKATSTDLENWRLITKGPDGYTASNAFALLTSGYCQQSKTECAVRRGRDGGIFLDRREYGGPLYEQIDNALNFALNNIRLGAEIGRDHRNKYITDFAVFPADLSR